MKLRKIFSILLTVALVASLTTIFANAETPVETYDLVAKGAVAGEEWGIIPGTWTGTLSGGANQTNPVQRYKDENGHLVLESTDTKSTNPPTDNQVGNRIGIYGILKDNTTYTLTYEIEFDDNVESAQEELYGTWNNADQGATYSELKIYYLENSTGDFQNGFSIGTVSKAGPPAVGFGTAYDATGRYSSYYSQTGTITFTTGTVGQYDSILIGPANYAVTPDRGAMVPGAKIIIKSAVITGDLADGADQIPAQPSQPPVTPEPEPEPDTPTFTTDATEHDVTATFKAGATAGTTYSVDIEWGALAFTYTGASQGGWNASELKYDGATEGAWAVDTEGGDKITVTNRSNAAVNVAFGYEAKNGYDGVSGTFTYDKTDSEGVINLATGEGRQEADAVTATLALDGAIDATGTIGAVKITIAAVEAQG